VVRRLLEPLTPGSVLGLSVVPDAEQGSPLAKGAAAYRSQGIAVKMLTKAETERLFDGLDLIDPGVTPVTHWHPDRPVDPDDPVHHMYAGVGIKH
jgi:hypothetical protein